MGVIYYPAYLLKFYILLISDIYILINFEFHRNFTFYIKAKK